MICRHRGIQVVIISSCLNVKTGVLLYEVHMAECPDIQAHPLLYHPIFISGFAFVTGKRHSSGQMFRTRSKQDMAVCRVTMTNMQSRRQWNGLPGVSQSWQEMEKNTGSS